MAAGGEVNYVVRVHPFNTLVLASGAVDLSEVGSFRCKEMGILHQLRTGPGPRRLCLYETTVRMVARDYEQIPVIVVYDQQDRVFFMFLTIGAFIAWLNSIETSFFDYQFGKKVLQVEITPMTFMGFDAITALSAIDKTETKAGIAVRIHGLEVIRTFCCIVDTPAIPPTETPVVEEISTKKTTEAITPDAEEEDDDDACDCDEEEDEEDGTPE